MVSTAIGTCDICNAENVEVCRCIISGIEALACDECRCNAPKAEPIDEAIQGQL